MPIEFRQPVAHWLRQQDQLFQLRLPHRLLLPDYRNHPGNLGLLLWRFGPATLVDPPRRLKNNLVGRLYTYDKKVEQDVSSGNPLKFRLELISKAGDALEQLHLDMVGVVLQVPLQVRAQTSGHLIFDNSILIRLERKTGSHALALDLGTSASCVALAKREENPTIKMLALDRQTPFLASSLVVNDENAKRTVTYKRLDLEKATYYLGFGSAHIYQGLELNPERVVPSIKRMVEAPPSLWRFLNMPPEMNGKPMAVILLEEYLSHLFSNMRKLNPAIWGKDLPIEEVVITVPNSIGYHYINRLKQAVYERINQCGSPLKKGLLTTDWPIVKRNIMVMREADAVAAEFLARPASKGGLGQAPAGTDCTIMVIDVGAGTTDTSLMRFQVARDHEQTKAQLELRSRQGVLLGGDDLDKVLAMFLFKVMARRELLEMRPEDKKRVFGSDKIDDLKLDSAFERLGLFESYTTLSQKVSESHGMAKKSQELLLPLDMLQKLRSQLYNVAKSLKESIGNSFYRYQPQSQTKSEEFSVTKLGENAATLLQTLYQEAENFESGKKWPAFEKVYQRQLQGLRHTKITVTCEFKPLLKRNFNFDLGEFWEFEPFKKFIRELTANTVFQALQSTKNIPRDQQLTVLLSGRVLAFPMIRESLLWSFLMKGRVFGYIFPNKHFHPMQLKHVVVRGALLSRIEGFNGSAFKNQVSTWYYLISHDQKNNQCQVKKLISGLDSFDEEGKVEATVTGVRLRKRADALETLTIIKLSLDNPEMALKWTQYPFQASRVYHNNIDKTGNFSQDGDRSVTLTLYQNGFSKVKIWPCNIRQQHDRRSQVQPLNFELDMSYESGLWDQFPL